MARDRCHFLFGLLKSDMNNISFQKQQGAKQGVRNTLVLTAIHHDFDRALFWKHIIISNFGELLIAGRRGRVLAHLYLLSLQAEIFNYNWLRNLKTLLITKSSKQDLRAHKNLTIFYGWFTFTPLSRGALSSSGFKKPSNKQQLRLQL